MPGARRGRTGRGWDAAPPRPRKTPRGSTAAESEQWAAASPSESLWGPDEADLRTTRPESRQPPDRGTKGADAPPRDPAEYAREICLRQLAVRPRTRSELAAALRKYGIDDDVAASVLDRYDEVGIIDDAAFARAWVSSRHHSRGLATRALATELHRKGVDKELADAALDELDSETEAATAKALVDRKLRGAGAHGAPDAVFRRLVGMLARKGYPAGLAIRVVKDAVAARDDESAAFAEWIDPDATDVVGEVEA